MKPKFYKIMKKLFLIFILAALLAPVSFSAKAQTISQAYREAVSELLTITNTREMAEETTVTAYEKMGLEFTIPTSQVVHAIYDNFWDKAADNYADIYAKYYTLDELHQLCDFYKTPLGEKMIRYNPEINREKFSVMDKYLPDATNILYKYIKK